MDDGRACIPAHPQGEVESSDGDGEPAEWGKAVETFGGKVGRPLGRLIGVWPYSGTPHQIEQYFDDHRRRRFRRRLDSPGWLLLPQDKLGFGPCRIRTDVKVVPLTVSRPMCRPSTRSSRAL